MVSTFESKGGAAKCAFRLYESFRRSTKHRIEFVVLWPQDKTSGCTRFIGERTLSHRIRRWLARRRVKKDLRGLQISQACNLFSHDRSPSGLGLAKHFKQADVVNLHWTAGFVDLQDFLCTLADETPIVWTLHDMNAFTGGCHYTAGCQRFQEGCGNCPAITPRSPGDVSAQIFRRKSRTLNVLTEDRLHIVTPSQWLLEEVRKSRLLSRFPSSCIPYGVDLQQFAPRDQRFARDVLGISQESLAILFVAARMSNYRKGFDLLLKALGHIRASQDVVLVSVGRMDKKFESPIRHVGLGRIDNERCLSMAYSAADIFVIPSRQDNLPNVVLESIACGTPVVGFNQGGLADMVRPGVSGLLAEVENPVSLAQAIEKLLVDKALREALGRTARELARKNFNPVNQVRAYERLFERIASNRHRP